MNIHFASTTFCWLPPESLVTPSSTVGVLMRSCLRYSSATRYSSRSSTTRPRVIFVSLAATIEVLMSSSRLRPSVLRSSLT